MKIKVLLISSSLLFSNFAIAAGWSSVSKVTRLYQRGDGHVYVSFANMTNPDSCPAADWYSLPTSIAHSERIFSLLMASKFADEPVKVYLSGCSANKPKISHVIAE
jgi:hypothetical protein